jgi:alpha-ribazole phosphatase
MLKIYLVRHGKTLWNNSMRYQGHTDIELSETGCRQAELLARRLADVKVDAFYASDLKRASKTAEILARPHQMEVQQVPALREIHFGAWEGLTYAQITAKYKEVADNWHAAPATVRIPEGENFEDVRDRAYGAILDLVKRHDPGTIVVVAHGGTIRTIICGLLELNLNHAFKIKQDNAALNLIEYYDGYGILSLMNDTGHLSNMTVV